MLKIHIKKEKEKDNINKINFINEEEDINYMP